VLVSQPTHPAHYTDDKRQYICSVCTGEFSVKPQSRAELMASFTGAELAMLLDVGCFIVAEKKSSAYMEQVLVNNSHLEHELSFTHWIRGVYLILDIIHASGGDSDGIIAVNTTRLIELDDLPGALVAAHERTFARARGRLQVQHFNGGPCLQIMAHATCLLRGQELELEEIERRLPKGVRKLMDAEHLGGIVIAGELKDVVAAALALDPHFEGKEWDANGRRIERIKVRRRRDKGGKKKRRRREEEEEKEEEEVVVEDEEEEDEEEENEDEEDEEEDEDNQQGVNSDKSAGKDECIGSSTEEGKEESTDGGVTEGSADGPTVCVYW
jgi:hypothetical protein